MDYRKAQSIEDFQQIIELQQKNLATKLSDLEKKDGFLSAEFTIKQLEEMNNDLCVMTCFDNNTLCGYLVASSIKYNRQFPLLASMIDRFDEISYKGKALNNYKSYISGPGCVDKKYRGHGIYLNLVQNVLAFLKQQSNPPDLRVLYVSTENSISINAQKKVGLEIVGQFEFNNKNFLILVMPL